MRSSFVAAYLIGLAFFGLALHHSLQTKQKSLQANQHSFAQERQLLTQLHINNAQLKHSQPSSDLFKKQVAADHRYAASNEALFELSLPKVAATEATTSTTTWTRLQKFLWSNHFFAILAALAATTLALWSWASGHPPKPKKTLPPPTSEAVAINRPDDPQSAP